MRKYTSFIKKFSFCLMAFLLSLIIICAQADVAIDDGIIFGSRQQNADAQADATVGNVITFGSWHQNSDAQDNTPILWRILEIQGDMALLISEKALDTRPYDLYRVDATWEQCTLRAWLNTELLNEAFTPEQQKAILVTTLENGTECPPTEDKLFLLNYSEIIPYLSSKECIAQYTQYASQKDGRAHTAFSWTRESNRMINMEGTKCSDIFLISNLAVRPAMWVSLSAMTAPETAQEQDFTPPAVYVPDRTAQETPSEGTVYRCLLLRGPQWGGNKAQFGFKLTELMPDETIFYPEAGFPEASGSDVREQLDKMAQLADNDDVTYIIVAAHGEPECYDFYLTTDYFSKNAYCSDVLTKETLVEKAAAIRGQVIILSLSCYSGTLKNYCGPLDPSRYTVWMSCGDMEYLIGTTEEMLYRACTSVQNDASGAIELGEISAFPLSAEDATPCVYGNPENFVFPVKNK